jgi:THO complex subunit 1
VRDFAKKAALEDKRIDARTRILQRQAAARAAAAAEATAARAAAQVDAPDVEMAVAPPKPAPAPAPATPAPSTAAAAAPASSPPIHPSLPAKPGAAGASRLAAVATPEPAPAPVPAAPSAPAEPPRDREIARLEEVRAGPPFSAPLLTWTQAKARWSWLALRAAREGGATLVFGNPKVVDQPGGGVDLDALADAVEERQREGLDPPKPTRPGGGAPDAGADVDGADGTDEGTPPSAGDGKDTEGKDAEGKDADGKDAEGKDTDIKVEDAELKAEVAKADASMEVEAPAAATGDVKMEDS